MKLRIKKSAIMLSCLLGANAMADDVITTDTVVVSASLTEQDLQHAQNTISVIDGDDIETSGRDTIPESIQDVPSVTLEAAGTPGISRVKLRGEGARRTVVMSNGQRIDDQKTEGGVPFLINPYFIERVEVVRGPSSVLFGSDALGGVVNVITKKASDQPFSPEFGLTYNSNGDGFTEYANFTGTAKRFKYAIGGMHSDVGDRILANGNHLDNSSYRQKGGNFDFRYDFTDYVTAGVAYEYFANSSRTSTTTDNTYKNYRGTLPKWERDKYSAFLEVKDLSDYVSVIKASVYHQTNDKDHRSSLPMDYSGTSVNVSTDTKNNQKGYGGNLQGEFSLSEYFYLVTGYDLRHEGVDSVNLFDVGVNTGVTGIGVSGNYLDDDYSQDTNSLYALLSTYITDKLTFNLGARWNHIQTGDGSSTRIDDTTVSVMSYTVSDTSVTSVDSYGTKTSVRTVGSAGFTYDLFDDTTLRLNWSQGFRAPGIQELFLYTRHAQIQMGNPDLTPEKSNNYEFGIRHIGASGLQFDATVFYSEAEDYIATYMSGYDSSYQEIYTFRNIDESTAFGLELEVNYEISYFEPYTSLTWMRRRYETPTQSTYDTATPDFKGRLGIKFNHGFDMFNYYVDPFIRFATENANENLDGSSYFDSVVLPGYVTYNLAIGTSFGGNNQYKIFVAAENITNVEYRTSELIDEPGRFYVVGGQASF